MIFDRLLEKSYHCSTMEAYDLLRAARRELLCQMKEQFAFYLRMSHACVDDELSKNYRIRADTISILIEKMIRSEERNNT